MKSFLLFLCLAAAEKLDRTYLPPPGAKFSGGAPGDIQVPFEVPKETYSTTARPNLNGPLSPEDTKVEIGINRLPPRPVPGDIPSGAQEPLDYGQNVYKVPTTTTSYAFTTTTTHPPSEYETTTGPINPDTGLPSTPFDFPSSNSGVFNPNYVNQGNQYQQIPQASRVPQTGLSQFPATSTLAPSSQFIGQNRPGFAQGYNFVQNQQPGFIPGTTQRPTSGEDFSRPGFVQGNNFVQNQRPGFLSGTTQRPSVTISGEDLSRPGFIQGDNFVQNQRPGILTGSTQRPTSNEDFSGPGFVQGNNFVQNKRPGFLPGTTQRPSVTSSGEDLLRPGFSQGNNFNQADIQRPGFIPGPSQIPNAGQSVDGTQYQGNKYPVSGFGQQNSLIPSTFAPGTTPTPSSIQYGGDLDQGIVSNQNVPFSQNNIPSVPSSNVQGSYYPGQNQLTSVTPGQQLPQFFQQDPNGQPGQLQNVSNQGVLGPQSISQTDEFGRPVQQNIAYQPFSTASPMPISNLNQYPGSTPGSQSAATTVYPAGSIPTTPVYPGFGNQGIQTGLVPRPERPQADSDRNAVILNYENVITPDGFAYSFDTSNGIHADESGTAVDGVKAKGSYSYIGDDGKLYSVVYTADENGFQPHGDHLPTPPPIPEAIKKVIEQAKKDQEDGISDDGTYNEDKYGHTKYRTGKPQRPNKINFDNDVPERYDGEYTQDNRKQQYRPQSGNKRPALPNQNDYEDIEDESQINGEDLVNYYQRPRGKMPSRRPINRIPENYNEEYNPDLSSGDENDRDESSGVVSSKRPGVLPSGNRKQFGGKFSVQSPDGSYESDTEVNGRPEQANKFEENLPGSISTEKSYTNDGFRRKPIGNKSVSRPGEGLSDIGNSNDNRESYANNKYATDKPSSFSDDDYMTSNSKVPSRRPGQFPSNAEISPVSEKYGDRIRPVTSTAQPFDQTEAYNYQDSKRPGGLNKYLPGKGYYNQPSSSTTNAPISDQFTGSPDDYNNQQSIKNRPRQQYRPISTTPDSTLDVTETNAYDSNDSRVPVTGEQVTDGPSSYRYSSNRRRPQSSTTPVPQENNKYYGNRVTEPDVNNQQNVRRPSGRVPSGANKYTTVAPIKENEGYQYLPPQRKFEQGAQYPGGSRVTSDRVPSQNNTYFNKDVAKPFTTPDASRNEDVPEDDYNQGQDIKQYQKPQYRPVQPNQRPTASQPSYDNYNQEGDNYDVSTPQRPGLSQDGKYRIDGSRVPGEGDKFTTIGSTRRPSYQTTSRPNQQHRPTVSVYETTQGVPAGVIPQGSDQYFGKDQDKATYVPSPPASQTNYYEATRPTLKPGQQNINRYIVNNQSPTTQGFFPTSTTPAQNVGRFDVRPTQSIYEQTSSQSPYQTTYRPMLTVSSGVDSEEAPSTTIRPNIPIRRPGFSQTQVPSTTYRPAHFPDKAVTEKQIAVDNYGRPLPDSQQPSFRPEYSVTPGNISPSGQVSQRPQGELKPAIDVYGRPIIPIEQGKIPSYITPGSSTTEKIIGEDFSGPKQAQKFDPERGYYY